MRNSQNKERFIAIMMFLLLNFALMAALIAVEIGSSRITLDVLFVNIFRIFVGEVALAVFSIFLIICVHWFQRHPSFGILETSVHSFIYKKRRNLALKNAQQIAPCLQAFLWQTLYRNKSLLGIDPGPDMGSLSPNGWRAVYRNGTAYYVFELLMKSEPEQDEKILQQSVNKSITKELLNYGINDLYGFYNEQQAIYLDRLIYDDVRRVLMFEVLYVASDNAAAALAKAWERDRPKAAAPEAEVYADEL